MPIMQGKLFSGLVVTTSPYLMSITNGKSITKAPNGAHKTLCKLDPSEELEM